MIRRFPRRWCDVCKQSGYCSHGLAVRPPLADVGLSAIREYSSIARNKGGAAALEATRATEAHARAGLAFHKCPKCGSSPGVPCALLGHGAVHVERAELAREADETLSLEDAESLRRARAAGTWS